LGDALRAATGADTDTGVVTQPYRLAGTTNYPDVKKLARGRVAGSTRISSNVGTLWSADKLRSHLQKQERAKAEAGGKARAEGRHRAYALQRVSSKRNSGRPQRLPVIAVRSFRKL
jgi:hypothetical protein